ncbi:MAG TPA: hypothetical protein VIF82_09570 [Burkholderiaceae bacterium]
MNLNKLKNVRIFIITASVLMPAIGFGQTSTSDTASFEVPQYFLGTFEDLVPDRVGGKTPNTTFRIKCGASTKCTVGFREGSEQQLHAAPIQELKFAKTALKYAKEHREVKPESYNAWVAQNLRPLLNSDADIESCIDLRMESAPAGYILLCRLTKDPWNRGTVIMLGTEMSSCGELFCSYSIYPAFRKQ